MSFCSGRPGPDGGQLISYKEALLHVDKVARAAASHPSRQKRRYVSDFDHSEKVSGSQNQSIANDVSLLEAVGQPSATTIRAKRSMPEYDTSAMDGFAICSQKTTQASEDSPVTFIVVDSIAAGDAQRISLAFERTENGCMEIMTGARFPESTHPSLDAVAKIEDVIVIEQWSTEHSTTRRYIQITRPVKPLQHRRPAGSDFSIGDLIVNEGTLIEPRHIAALASLGIWSIPINKLHVSPPVSPVWEKQSSNIKIGVLSTGSEVVSAEQVDKPRQGQQIADSNGPYLVSALHRFLPHATVEHFGIALDTDESLCERLRNAIDGGCDVIVTSGGVSKGRHDLVRHVIEKKLEGRILFHGVAVRPGAPILFATCDTADLGCTTHRQVAIFGAPGNPLAVATTLRFFIQPYLEKFLAQTSILDTGVTEFGSVGILSCAPQSLTCSNEEEESSHTIIRKKPTGSTAFWLARRRKGTSKRVNIVEDQASYKLSGLLSADCWVIVPDTQCEIRQGDVLMSCSL